MPRFALALFFLVLALVIGTSMARAEEVLVAIDLNGQVVSDGELVERDGDRITIALDLARRLRLILPAKPGDRVTLTDLPGVAAILDPLSQTLHLKVEPNALERTEIGGFLAGHAFDRPTETGFFANYTLLGEGGGGTALASGLFDVGLFSPLGTGTADFSASTDTGVIRLQSHIERELDENNILTIGDSLLFPGAINGAFPFGGVALTSRTAENGGRATTPVQSILGQAALPSTVDVFVNDALQSRQTIEAGPFDVQNLPTVTGQGEVRVVVRDVLGREQVITRSFFGSNRLLAPDAEEYGFDAGLVRQGFGVQSFDYAEPFAAGTWRRGLDTDDTIELHGEASSRREVLGGQNSVTLGNFGVAHLGGAISDGFSHTGELVTAGFDSQRGRLNLGLSTELVDGHFTELGFSRERITRESTSAHLSYDLKKLGAVDLSLIRFRTESERPNMTIAGGYSLSIANRAFIEFSVSDNLDSHDLGGLLTFSYSFGDGPTVSASTARSQGKLQTSLEGNIPIQGEDGFGYDASVQHGIADRAEGGISYRDAFGEFTGEIGQFNGDPIGRVTANGSVELLDGHLFTARQTNGGFAVVDTGEPGIRVTLDGQPQGITAADGTILVPHLRPGELNHVAIDPEDVPLDATLPATEQAIVPRAATGYIVRFPVKQQHSATGTLVGTDGTVLPVAIQIRLRRTDFVSVIGHDGGIYLDDVADGDVIEADVPGHPCTAAIHLPATAAAQYQLGRLACR